MRALSADCNIHMKAITLFASAAIAIAAAATSLPDAPEHLVIIHTNDTHSQIDPDSKGLGGIARRKALIDSIRAAAPASVLVDAGDAVQGSLFFTLYKGEVEDSLMNMLGYDIRILGNHEFDNGTDALAHRWKTLTADRLSTNYDFSALPALDSIFSPYTIRTFGDKRVAFMAINLDPKGMIADHNAQGVVFLDPVEAANATAWHLRHNERADYVVAITHIGYSGKERENDLDLAKRTKNVDLIIGGHSHTPIDDSSDTAPLHRVTDAAGDTVVIVQNGKGGVTIGEVDIDFASGRISGRLIPVDSRLDSLTDPAIEKYLEPFRAGIDSLVSVRLATTPADLPHRSAKLLNLASDFVADEGSRLAGKKVDLAIMNKGGLRRGLLKGYITRGDVMELMPFDNRITVMEIKGSDLTEAFDIMARAGGNGISKSARALFDPDSGRCTAIEIAGEPIAPDRIYTLATIDYLANGGDYMTPLKRGKVIATDDRIAYDAFADYLTRLRRVRPDDTIRMKAAEQSSPHKTAHPE